MWHFIWVLKGTCLGFSSIQRVLKSVSICLITGIQTKAEKKGGDYVINGGKMWTTTGFQADWMCLLANTSDGQVHQNKSLICLPMDAKGKL